MRRVTQVWQISAYNFRQWAKNTSIVIVFALAFVMCYLLSDKVINFAFEAGTTIQLVEAFIWTFGNANSIHISSLLLVLLLAVMPFVCADTPFYLTRTSRATWIWEQILYIVLPSRWAFRPVHNPL